MRIDKWLWCVRIFKSRSKATDACKKGHVKLGDARLKASYLVRKGDQISLKKNGFNLTYRIVDLLDRRVSATLAAPCYENLTPPEELNKFRDWFIGKAPAERRMPGLGRPTKKERREIESYKDELYLDDWFLEEE